ncbi:MAG: DEAD/DEAH box helicase family protein, partial [Pseudomonadota bacterium]
QDKDNWKRSDIVISTVQSFNNGKYRQIFKPNDFDLLISDEAHRSITGNYREVFEYFVGFKLGLTATPKNYLKNFKDAPLNDERELERRTLLDTYKTFGCAGGEPTFRYGLLDGVKDNVLINPRIIEIKTDITTQLLSEEGYSIKSVINNPDPLVNEDMEVEERFGKRDFEKKFFSPSTNYEFCKIFLQKALKDPVTGEIGKTIIFCVRQSHATEITKILNELASQIWQEKYKSDFAVQITSDVKNAQEKTTQFKNNQLLGKANFNPEYKTSKARVCVTVGMMTTGYDCADILNICLMRPIFSPSEFVQIKGRGTRKHNFSENCTSKALEEEYADANKEIFLLFDYFANCTYFEEEFNYDDVIKLPKPRTAELTYLDEYQNGNEISEVIAHTNLSLDEVKSIKEIIIGIEGMKIDRMFINFEDEIAKNEFIAEKVKAGDFDAAEKYIEENYIDKPSEFYTLDKLNKSLKHYEANLGRKISLKEMLKKTFGIIYDYKSKDEISDEAFTDFAKEITEQDSVEQVSLQYFYKALLENKAIRDKIEQKDFSFLFAGEASSILSSEQFKAIPLELRNKVIEHINRNQKYTELLN